MKRGLAVVAMLLIAAVAVAQPVSNAPALPLQHLVFVVDNSGSMEQSDPLRLRGVAAGLVLDAAEISSNVEAGLVLFSDTSTTDGRLHPPDKVRNDLHGGRLPAAAGGTNMYDALAKGIAMLASSKAAIKRIVLITDGMPTSNANEIVSQLAPNAQAAGIQIFAIGMSNQVDRNYLDAVTRPTGGRTLVAEQHHLLLRRAKELMGDLDNVYTLEDRALAPAQNEYEFSISTGVDRARITAILDHPSEFAPGDITLTLDGPPSAGERPYVVRSTNGDRVAAWTAFFSTPGKYRLRVETRDGHKGLRLFVEALSSLRLSLTLNPPLSAYEFGSNVKVLVTARTASGSVDPATLSLNGTVLMPGGGTEVITFNGAEGEFRVRDVVGRHTVIVRGTTALARAEARLPYEAIPPDPPTLTSVPAKLDFIRPLGPTDPQIEATFKVVPQFAAGTRSRPIRVGFMIATPTGEAELIAKGGGVIRLNGPALFSLPAAGTEMTLRIKLHPDRPLPLKASKESTVLRIYSNDAAALAIPCEYRVGIPVFEVRKAAKTFSLWWDALQPRIVALGRVHTDLAIDSDFTVTLPDQILDPNRGTKIADVALRIGDKTLDSEPADAGKVRYGPIELEAGTDVPLEIIVTPSTTTGWQYLPTSRKTFVVDLASSLGMRTKISPAFQSLGPPLFGTIDRHGRPIVRVALVTFFAVLLVLLTVRRLGVVRRFWPYRPGEALMLAKSGDICIGDASTQGTAALILPNSGSPIDDTSIGRVSVQGRHQYVESPSGHLVVTKSKLEPGDSLVVSDDPSQGTQLWELTYLAPIPGEGAEVEVRSYPAEWTSGRLVRRTAISIVLLWGLSVFLGTALAAGFAYHLGFIESIYLWMLK